MSGMKRALDVGGAGLLLVTLSPLLLLLAAAVRIWLGSPILFRQERPGLNGRPFTLLKFRSMTDDRGPDGEIRSDASRMTPLGAFLRRFSLDELPEFWCVLAGSMSLVGPRPLLMEYLALYTPEQARRHEVRPGVTGWAQVNGRNSLSWEDRFGMDVWYVDHQSFKLDMRILMMTIRSLWRREGISESGHVTMTRYTGPRKPATE